MNIPARLSLPFFLICILPAVAAEPAGDVKAGLQTSKRWCASCHDVTGHQANVQPGIISFPQIARLDGVSMNSLIGIQTMPHVPMLDLNLSRQTQRDIAAYILTLKDK